MIDIGFLKTNLYNSKSIVYPSKLFMKKIIFPIICLFYLPLFLKAQTPDWSTSIASILYNNCTTCHHEGGIAPFSLLTYTDAVDNGFNIQSNINAKKMPPWPADPNYSHFWDERVLSDDEITSINDWVNGGMPSGDLNLAPAAPLYGSNSLMIAPDDSIILPVYTIPNDSDNYRSFVIHSNYSVAKYISSIEFIPGNPSVVHHSSFHQDTSDVPNQLDLADTLPGYATDGINDPSNTAVSFGAWLPGNGIFKLPSNMGFKIPPGADFIISIHYSPGSMNQKDSSRLYLKFCSTPDSLTRTVYKSKWLFPAVLVNGPLNIPPNTVMTFNEISFPTTHKSLLGLNPHSHHVCVSWQVQMVSASGDTTNLISIPNWSFYWQYNYLLTKILEVPALATMIGEATFDNTTNNPDNPNNPPKAVHEGSQSSNEMMNCGFILMDYQSGDENIILDSAFYGLPTEIENTKKGIELEIYPNPSSDVFHFVSQLNTHNVNWILTNSLGSIVKSAKQMNVPSGIYIQNVDVSNLPQCIYHLILFSDNEIVSKQIEVVR